MLSNRYVVIMAGGIGSRFWPVSKASFPKQFIDILGTGKSLIRQTYERFLKIIPSENIYIVTNSAYFDLVKEQIPEIADNQIIGEPSARNTAPCIAYATFKINAINPDAVTVVSPSDHLILNEGEFLRYINNALDFAEANNALVALGIKPHRPDTGYGYIQYLTEEKAPGVNKVKTFTEKPNLELAKTFLESGDFLWNAGIFIWSNSSILSAFDEYLHDMYTTFKNEAHNYNTPNEIEAIKKVYSQCTNISIDYGILEKASNVYVLPAEFGWSDLGTWASLYEVHNHDELNNAINGKQVQLYDTSNCMVHAPDDKLVVIKGMDNLIVVDSHKVLLICDKNKEQEIKEIVTDIKLKFGEKYS